MIYLDNNATTKIDDLVLQEMLPFFNDIYGNASSQHYMGEEAYLAVESARRKVAQSIGAKDYEVFFTNSATESSNIVIKSLYRYVDKDFIAITSPIEHSSVSATFNNIKAKGAKVLYCELNPDGSANVDSIKKRLKDNDVNLVSIMYVNNETGTINDIKSIAKLCQEHQVFFHTDATQALGKIKININEWGINAASFSAHKLYGPKGVGALYIDDVNLITPLLDGGLQNTITSGTINTPNIIGFGKACEIIDLNNNIQIKVLRDFMYTSLKEKFPNIEVNADLNKCVPNTLNISIPEVKTEDLLSMLEETMISGGSACKSGDFKPSKIIEHINSNNSKCAIRISLSKYSTEEDIKLAIEEISNCIKKIRSK